MAVTERGDKSKLNDRYYSRSNGLLFNYALVSGCGLLSSVNNAGTFYSVLLIPFRGGTTGLNEEERWRPGSNHRIDRRERYTTSPPLIRKTRFCFLAAGKPAKRGLVSLVSSLIQHDSCRLFYGQLSR